MSDGLDVQIFIGPLVCAVIIQGHILGYIPYILGSPNRAAIPSWFLFFLIVYDAINSRDFGHVVFVV